VTTTRTQPATAPGREAGHQGPLTGAVAGLLSLGTFLGIAELAASFVGPTAAPAIAVGQRTIDAAPHELKEFAVRAFGEADKLVLLVGIFTTLALLSAAAGVVAARRLPIGLGALVLLSAVTALAAVTAPTGRLLDALPAGLGGLAAAGVLHLLLAARPAADGTSPGQPLSRRALLRYGVAIATGAAAAGALGRRLLADAGRAAASRAGLVLPAPASPAPPPVGDPQVAGAVPFYTPNADFYRVDTALTVPEGRRRHLVAAHLRDGRPPVTLSLDDLLARPLVERDITLTCVSNEVGGPVRRQRPLDRGPARARCSRSSACSPARSRCSAAPSTAGPAARRRPPSRTVATPCSPSP
jgi:hypothetical protein